MQFWRRIPFRCNQIKNYLVLKIVAFRVRCWFSGKAPASHVRDPSFDTCTTKIRKLKFCIIWGSSGSKGWSTHFSCRCLGTTTLSNPPNSDLEIATEPIFFQTCSSTCKINLSIQILFLKVLLVWNNFETIDLNYSIKISEFLCSFTLGVHPKHKDPTALFYYYPWN